MTVNSPNGSSTADNACLSTAATETRVSPSPLHDIPAQARVEPSAASSLTQSHADVATNPAVRAPTPVSATTTKNPGTLRVKYMNLVRERWQSRNATDVGLRLAGDASAACAAGFLVAPVITMIDRAIIENASSTHKTITTSILSSLQTLFLRPHHFLLSRPFGLVFTLYAGTYISANILDTLFSTFTPPPTSTPPPSTSPTDHHHHHRTEKTKNDPRDPTTTTSGLPKFLFTSLTNITLCVHKDTHFARYFGAPSSSSSKTVPTRSKLLFAARDALTVFASFNLPPLIAPRLGGMLDVAWKGWDNHVSTASCAQFLAPAAVQVISTPIHLLGLDLYNRGGRVGGGKGVSLSSRLQTVSRDWGKSCVARVCRIVPAFGVGGVVNTKVRVAWMERLPSKSGS
ncbi:MAG: hypothetical protein M1831_007117 [Alyxoria varia]|nr:MAG: hypothetical protein M1831_007117 [Alyxoria varia]